VESVFEYDRFRNCYKLVSGCPISGRTFSCVTDIDTSIEFAGHCTGESDCDGGPKESSIKLQSPYDETQLAADVQTMRDSVSWDEFVAWNSGGDVTVLADGAFIFPQNAELNFYSYYYTDDDTTFIDKGWVLVRNNTDDDIALTKTFYPSNGSGSISEDYTVPANSEIEIGPPDSPGHVAIGSPCDNACNIGVEFKCQIKSKSKSLEDERRCFTCAFKPNDDGFRDAYYSAELIQNYEGNILDSDIYTTIYTSEWSGGSTINYDFKSQDCSGAGGVAINSLDCDGLVTGVSTYSSEIYEYNISASISRTLNPGNNVYWDLKTKNVTGSYVGGSVSADCVANTGDTYFCSLMDIGPVGTHYQSAVYVPMCSSVSTSGFTTTTITSEVTKDTVTFSRSIDHDDHSSPNPDVYSTYHDKSSGTLTLLDKVGMEGVDDDIEYGEEDTCSELCSHYMESTPIALGDQIYSLTDVQYKLRINQITCPDPERYTSITVLISWYEIAMYDDCGAAPEYDRKTRTVILTREGAPGSYSWSPVPDVIGELAARTALGGKNGSLCVRYVTAVITSMTPDDELP